MQTRLTAKMRILFYLAVAQDDGINFVSRSELCKNIGKPISSTIDKMIASYEIEEITEVSNMKTIKGYKIKPAGRHYISWKIHQGYCPDILYDYEQAKKRIGSNNPA